MKINVLCLLFVFLFLGAGCMRNKNGEADSFFLGSWQSNVLESSDIGFYLLEFQFLSEGQSIQYIHVGEDMITSTEAFVGWGTYQVVDQTTIKVYHSHAGGLQNGKIIEKEVFEGEEIFRFEIESGNRIFLLSDEEPKKILMTRVIEK